MKMVHRAKRLPRYTNDVVRNLLLTPTVVFGEAADSRTGYKRDVKDPPAEQYARIMAEVREAYASGGAFGTVPTWKELGLPPSLTNCILSTALLYAHGQNAKRTDCRARAMGNTKDLDQCDSRWAIGKPSQNTANLMPRGLFLPSGDKINASLSKNSEPWSCNPNPVGVSRKAGAETSAFFESCRVFCVNPFGNASDPTANGTAVRLELMKELRKMAQKQYCATLNTSEISGSVMPGCNCVIENQKNVTSAPFIVKILETVNSKLDDPNRKECSVGLTCPKIDHCATVYVGFKRSAENTPWEAFMYSEVPSIFLERAFLESQHFILPPKNDKNRGEMANRCVYTSPDNKKQQLCLDPENEVALWAAIKSINFSSIPYWGEYLSKKMWVSKLLGDKAAGIGKIKALYRSGFRVLDLDISCGLPPNLEEDTMLCSKFNAQS